MLVNRETRMPLADGRPLIANTTTLATYSLELIGPPNTLAWLLIKVLRETEENLTDLLPEGYSVRIKEWDE